MSFRIIIFTDLDGTLLDKDTYSFERALPAIKECHMREIPIVVVTSKTFKETKQWCEILEIDSRFIFENGGGIYFNERRIIKIGLDYKSIREKFNLLKKSFNIRGFGDMDVTEIMKYTGLDYEKAILAKERLFSEPFLFFEETGIDGLMKKAAEYGLQVVAGGRFYHLMRAGQSKGEAVRVFLREAETDIHALIDSIGIGDSPNDISLLKATRWGVYVGRDPELLHDMRSDGMYISREKGPGGWCEGVLHFLKILVE